MHFVKDLTEKTSDFWSLDELRLPGADSCAGPVREFSYLTI
jgi:hypothetical protein